MHLAIVPKLFSLLESHASGAKFMRPDQKWEEICGMMGNLAADWRRRKGQLSNLVGTLCRDFREHEEEEERTKVGARTLYLNMPKVEMADSMCSGYRKTAKRLTSREVRLIVNHLSEPSRSPGC